MDRYTVVYLADAEAELASIWNEKDDRSRVRLAADQAEQLLAANPETRSDFLSEGLWRLQIEPLRFFFSIREADRIVEVSNVFLIEG
jgi:hypothetical protein